MKRLSLQWRITLMTVLLKMCIRDSGSTYAPNKYGEQIITGELHVEKSGFTDGLEPTNTVKATARITLIDDRVFTPTLEPPTYSKQLYGGDLCFLVFADKYLSGGTATVNGETVSGKFTLDKDQKIYCLLYTSRCV